LVRIPPEGCRKATPLAGLVRQAEKTKITLLREIGVNNPLEGEMTPFRQNELVADQTIDTFSAVVRLNLTIIDTYPTSTRQTSRYHS
jgi:hypothetical protein